MYPDRDLAMSGSPSASSGIQLPLKLASAYTLKVSSLGQM